MWIFEGTSTIIHDIFCSRYDGMDSGPIQNCLFEEDSSKVGLIYSSLMEIATAEETAINYKSGV